MDIGVCFARIKKFFYNIKTRRCEEFWYGGCGGNNNLFDRVGECHLECYYY
jgi:papilin